MNFTDQQFSYSDTDLLEFLGQQESQNIRWGDAYLDDLLAAFDDSEQQRGAALPWSRSRDLIRFRECEVSIHAGMNGHHKSVVTGQLAMWFALQGEPTGIMSFEMPIGVTQRRMCQQAAGSKHPPHNFIRQWSAWNHRHLAYYNKLDTTPSSRVLGAVFYMAKDLGCKHIMIDSLTKCGLPYGERGPEKYFIDALCATAKTFKIHIHLICHVRKPSNVGHEAIPTKFDVRGAGEITDLVDNVIIHWHDKKKHQLRHRQAAGIQLSEKEQEYFQRPDQRLIVEKQRNGAFEGTIGLEMHESMQAHQGRVLEFPLPKADLLEATQ